MKLPGASIIINNFNYGRFLRASIDSALEQKYSNTEVVVVDDGSTDESRVIIESYGHRIIPILKENGGQGSAFNAGFACAIGDVIIFLDADDMLRPTAVEQAMPLFEDASIVKVQWRLTVVDGEGNISNRKIPQQRPPDGDLRQAAISDGPDIFRWPPTSGNAWSRSYLEQVLPAPESLYETGVDTHLFQLAPFFGRIASLPTSQSFYRLHGNNDSRTIGFEKKLARQIAFYKDYSARAIRHCNKNGWAIDTDRWQENSWWCRLQRATKDLETTLPAGSSFILIDENRWGLKGEYRNRPVIPFTEKDGEYWGLPSDDAAAVLELERSRRSGANHLVIAWSSFWVLKHFSEFTAHLRASHPCRLSNNRLKIFEVGL